MPESPEPALKSANPRLRVLPIAAGKMVLTLVALAVDASIGRTRPPTPSPSRWRFGHTPASHDGMKR
jgi:hypothetical protein